MANAKPTLGYASRTEAVLALRKQGLKTAQIAARIGIEPKTVSSLEACAVRSVKRRGTEEVRTVLFSVELLGALEPHAARRGITANTLARRIVDAAVDGKLIDAVLDDAHEVAAYLGGRND